MAKLEQKRLKIASVSSPVALGGEETNSSNNSSVQKKNEHTAVKTVSTKKFPKQKMTANQSSRRSDLLEQLHNEGYVYENHVQPFLSFLNRVHPEARNVKSKVFKNQLMLSENMDEIPTSFAKKWLMVVCPVGVRCLVVASMGHTGAYSKTGYHIISHPSNLPLGNKLFQGYGSCVLDCIYFNETETYFVLDMMMWDGQPLYDCEAQVRFRQLQDKIREHDLARPSHLNPYPFIPLKTFTPTKNNIVAAVKTAPFMIDRLMFYHKEGTYNPGTTPLALWLTLDRLPTKMKIEIPEMGIVTAISYKDPVALALAHGVSPAIISQVYPTNPGFRAGSGNGLGPRQEAPSQGRKLREFSPPQNFSRAPRGYYGGGQKMRPDSRPMHSFDEFNYLSDLMLNMNLGHSEHPMFSMASSFNSNFNSNNSCAMSRFDNFNSNNTAMSRFDDFNSNITAMSQYDHFNFKNSAVSMYDRFGSSPNRKSPKSLPQKPGPAQKGKPQLPKPDEQKQPNWETPHAAMKSQWMIRKPDNFEEDYLVCITPLGKRRLIVAANGKTCTYNRYGKLVDTYTSELPSGAPHLVSGGSELTVLDSFWCGSLQKFFVFDVLHWRKQPFYDAEAEFRFFWLTDKISEMVLKQKKKEVAVELLPMVAATKEHLSAALSKTKYRVDGLLFYQKSSGYTLSASSSALWLKVDMMEELLGYTAPEETNFKPSNDKERKQRLHFVNLNAGVVKVESPKVTKEDSPEVSREDSAEVSKADSPEVSGSEGELEEDEERCFNVEMALGDLGLD